MMTFFVTFACKCSFLVIIIIIVIAIVIVIVVVIIYLLVTTMQEIFDHNFLTKILRIMILASNSIFMRSRNLMVPFVLTYDLDLKSVLLLLLLLLLL